jgi:hypothetical protein
MWPRLAVAAALLLASMLVLDSIEARQADRWPAPGARVHLHAHNAYPESGRWSDRIDRALLAGAPHLAIEQDLVWVPPSDGRPGRSVVAHDAPARGDEPTLDDYFFARVEPQMIRALRERRVDTWPMLVLHLDFKTNEPEHHRYAWDLLGRYRDWLTTAERTSDGSAASPLVRGPLLVLTEQGDGQEQAFHLAHPVGTPLRLFGTVPAADLQLPEGDLGRASALARASPEALVPSGATSYRRWTNHSWAVIERGGPPQAAAWTVEDATRLRSVVARAHSMGLWIRFYGLNGHEAAGDGWSAGYNFGTVDGVRSRWRAAIENGVDFVATDQYESLAAELRLSGPGDRR